MLSATTRSNRRLRSLRMFLTDVYVSLWYSALRGFIGQSILSAHQLTNSNATEIPSNPSSARMSVFRICICHSANIRLQPVSHISNELQKEDPTRGGTIYSLFHCPPHAPKTQQRPPPRQGQPSRKHQPCHLATDSNNLIPATCARRARSPAENPCCEDLGYLGGTVDASGAEEADKQHA